MQHNRPLVTGYLPFKHPLYKWGFSAFAGIAMVSIVYIWVILTWTIMNNWPLGDCISVSPAFTFLIVGSTVSHDIDALNRGADNPNLLDQLCTIALNYETLHIIST